MSERLIRLDDTALEAALRDLGGALAYPPAPGLVEAVHARVAALPAPRAALWERWLPARGTFRRSLVLALVALLVLAAVAAAVRFGVPGIRLAFGEPSPSPSPGATQVPTPAPLGSALGLGAETTLADVRATVDFRVAVPSDPALGEPDAVFYDARVPGGHVALVWGARPGIPAQAGGTVAALLAEFRGRVEQDFFQKVISGGGTTVRPVEVEGAQGWWLAGDPHVIFYLDGRGDFVERASRLVGNVLIWERDGITYRFESGLGLDEALRIAGSVG